MLVLKKDLGTAVAPLSEPAADEGEPQPGIWVISTSFESTLSAMAGATTLADRLGGRITVLVPQVVPYPLPLESPPVLLDWTEKRFQMIASLSPAETSVRIYLCRDPLDITESVLDSGSLVVIGSRKKWWPRFESRLVRKLRRSGHHVILTDTE